MTDTMIIVLMGVCGCGKTTIGEALANKLKWLFADADDFHPQSNKDKMSKGLPLSDEDRIPWLCQIYAYITNLLAAGKSGVVTCSALKKFYRAILSTGEVPPGMIPTGSQHQASELGCDVSTVPSTAESAMADTSKPRSSCPVTLSQDTGMSGTRMSTGSQKDVIFVLLTATQAVLERRMGSREGHFMPASLLTSQLATLEPPDGQENHVVVSVDQTVEGIVTEITEKLNLKL